MEETECFYVSWYNQYQNKNGKRSSPIDPDGPTFVDRDYSKAYLRHLFAANEFLGRQIASIHNLGFYLWLARESRKHILNDDFAEWKNKMIRQMNNRL